jgi:hypothetical protein
MSLNFTSAPAPFAGIHPRFKHEVGRRLALAYRGARSPTITGCSQTTSTLEVVFSVAEADKLILQWSDSDYNTSNWGTQDSDSSGLMVCVGTGSEGVADPNQCLTDASMWTMYPLRLVADAEATGKQPPPVTTQTVAVHLPSGGPKPVAVRYAWPIGNGDTCCPFRQVVEGLTPCVPGSCPLITATNSLPVNPFYATLQGGKCKCMAPQKCDT